MITIGQSYRFLYKQMIFRHNFKSKLPAKMSRFPRTGYLWMGEGTLQVPLDLFALNRRRLVDRLRGQNLGNAIVVLQGGDDFPFYDTNLSLLFRQESYFVWAFGVVEPAFYGAIEVESGKSILFIPRLPPSFTVWYGPIWTPDDFRNKYEVDEVYFTDEIAEILASKSPDVLLTLAGTNPSGRISIEAKFDGIDNFNIDNTVLFPQMADLRVVKTDYEIEVMRYVVRVSSEGHNVVMKMARPGRSEYQCESEFLHYCYSVGGCRRVGYTSICGSGPNSAILHYGHAGAPNDRFLEDGDMCLFDMGANYFGYTADVTCTFPANGKFTDDQRIIYNAVLNSKQAGARAVRPGVLWSHVSNEASRALLEGLRTGGLIRGSTDDLLNAGIARVFMPHGLGHQLGLDVHDVGGFLPGRAEKSDPKSYSRFTRPILKGMVLTIEPGCYFIDQLLDEALADPATSAFLIPDVVNRFRGSGGVRIEDVVVVTDDGIEDITRVPRTVEEIENWIAGVDDAKYSKRM